MFVSEGWKLTTRCADKWWLQHRRNTWVLLVSFLYLVWRAPHHLNSWGLWKSEHCLTEAAGTSATSWLPDRIMLERQCTLAAQCTLKELLNAFNNFLPTWNCGFIYLVNECGQWSLKFDLFTLAGFCLAVQLYWSLVWMVTTRSP